MKALKTEVLLGLVCLAFATTSPAHGGASSELLRVALDAVSCDEQAQTNSLVAQALGREFPLPDSVDTVSNRKGGYSLRYQDRRPKNVQLAEILNAGGLEARRKRYFSFTYLKRDQGFYEMVSEPSMVESVVWRDMTLLETVVDDDGLGQIVVFTDDSPGYLILSFQDRNQALRVIACSASL